MQGSMCKQKHCDHAYSMNIYTQQKNSNDTDCLATRERGLALDSQVTDGAATETDDSGRWRQGA